MQERATTTGHQMVPVLTLEVTGLFKVDAAVAGTDVEADGADRVELQLERAVTGLDIAISGLLQLATQLYPTVTTLDPFEVQSAVGGFDRTVAVLSIKGGT